MERKQVDYLCKHLYHKGEREDKVWVDYAHTYEWWEWVVQWCGMIDDSMSTRCMWWMMWLMSSWYRMNEKCGVWIYIPSSSTEWAALRVVGWTGPALTKPLEPTTGSANWTYTKILIRVMSCDVISFQFPSFISYHVNAWVKTPIILHESKLLSFYLNIRWTCCII